RGFNGFQVAVRTCVSTRSLYPCTNRPYLLLCVFIRGIISKSREKFFGLVNIAVVSVSQDYDGSRIFKYPDKNSIVAMPPSVVVNDFFVVGVFQHSPSQSIILYAF